MRCTLTASIVLVLAVDFSAAQTPGGVSTGLTVWYKADLNVVGSPVSSWNTSGGSAAGYNITQATAGNRPGITAGSTNYKRYNYNPRIDFVVASSTRLENTGTAPNLYGTAGSIFMVTDQNSGAGNGTGLTYSANTSTQRIQIKPSFRFQTSTGSSGYTGDFSAPTEYASTSASMLSVSGLGPTAVHRLNSVPIACSNCGVALYNPAITTGLRVGRNGLGGEHVDCDMGEIVFYSGALTAAEVARVESYLALKYGITRGGNSGIGSAYNYVNSSGTTIWDKAANDGYNNDIAGIGRDDGSALVQKQSISVNTGESVSIGLVSVDASNATNANTFSVSNSFLVWGNNGSLQSTVFTDPNCFSNMPSGVQAKIQRVWKVQVTGFSQTVTVGFETSAFVGSSPITNLRLLVDNDGTNWSNATVVSGAVLDGTRIEFAGVSFSAANPYFTLATINYLATPLPVEMLWFDAQPGSAHSVDLDWATATESNNSHFEVERSADGVTFSGIGELAGNGTSLIQHNYDYTDALALPGMNYYRLKQVDNNGAFTYSEIRSVEMGAAQVISAYPNPADDFVVIAGVDLSTPGALRLFNSEGQEVPLPGGTLVNSKLNVNTLPRGIYIARVGDQVARIVKR